MAPRKLQSAALFVTIFGAMLLLPPLVQVFNLPNRILGVPAIVIYLFAVWLGLIVVTALFARRLTQTPEPAEKTEAND